MFRSHVSLSIHSAFAFNPPGADYESVICWRVRNIARRGKEIQVQLDNVKNATYANLLVDRSVLYVQGTNKNGWMECVNNDVTEKG